MKYLAIVGTMLASLVFGPGLAFAKETKAAPKTVVVAPKKVAKVAKPAVKAPAKPAAKAVKPAAKVAVKKTK